MVYSGSVKVFEVLAVLSSCPALSMLGLATEHGSKVGLDGRTERRSHSVQNNLPAPRTTVRSLLPPDKPRTTRPSLVQSVAPTQTFRLRTSSSVPRGPI